MGEKAPKYLKELSKKFESNNETTQGDLDLGHLGTQGRQYKKPLVNFNKDIDNRRKREVMGAYVDLNRDDSENNNANEDVGKLQRRAVKLETTEATV